MSPSPASLHRPPPPPPPKEERRPWRLVAIVAAAVAGAGLLGLAGLTAVLLAGTPQIPDRESLWSVRRSPGITFVAHDGAVIASRGARYGDRVLLKDLPPYVPRAFLAAEDRRFYQHGPVELRAILRAARRDLATGRAAEGGSTLTQQLARTLFLKPEHTLRRKLQEAVLAGRLEQMLGKDNVLELYLNRTFFGAQAYGLDAAARLYFGVPAAQLTLPQAALLAGVPNAPTRLSPITDYEGAWARAGHVLAAMEEERWITPAERAQALADPPRLAPPPAGEGEMSPVLDAAAAQVGALASGQADLVVRLTIDRALQDEGLQALRAGVLGEGRGRGVSEGALVALAPDGAIRAMVGGIDPRKAAFNRVTQAHRQPGSAFKAFVYGAAMERGMTPQDVRDDAPVSLGRWTPTNYGGSYAGQVTLAEALARSINTVSVRLTLEVGPDEVAAFARRLGLATIPPHPGPSIALGAYEVTLLQLAGGYQVFQTGGGRTTPYLIEEIHSTSGMQLYVHPASAPTPVYEPLYASRMVRMLEGVITSGTGTAANLGRPAAGKTGTSQRWRDAWFIGFTPDLLTGVWVGNDDDRPTRGVTGGEIPARIWRAFMTTALKARPASDFSWLQAEPQEPAPETLAVAAPGVVEDQPPTLAAGGEVSPPNAAGAQMEDSYQEDGAPGPEGPPSEGRDQGGYQEAPPPPPAYDEEQAPPAEAYRRRVPTYDEADRPPPEGYRRRAPAYEEEDRPPEGYRRRPPAPTWAPWRDNAEDEDRPRRREPPPPPPPDYPDDRPDTW